MMRFTNTSPVALFVIFGLAISCGNNDEVNSPIDEGKVEISSIIIGGQVISLNSWNSNIQLDQAIVVSFSRTINITGIEEKIGLMDDQSNLISLEFTFLNNNKTISCLPSTTLKEKTIYTLIVSNVIEGAEGETFEGKEVLFETLLLPLEITSFTIDGISVLDGENLIININFQPYIYLSFSYDMIIDELKDNITLTKKNGSNLSHEISFDENTSTYQIIPSEDLNYLTGYVLSISNQLKSINGNNFTGFETLFYTKVDETFKFPEIYDEDLLTLIQRQTFNYFWDFAHPVSGMIRERSNNNHDNVITIGATGFGLMSIIVGIERGFVSRADGVARLEKIINYLKDEVPRFHGIWPHWITGDTAEVIPFAGNEIDNGADLSESTYLIVGLLTVRQYLDEGNLDELAMINQINTFWNEMEWDWYTKNGAENVLYWHWSPDYGWDINLQMTGYNETLITYVMAASSPTHAIEKEVYEQGFAQNGGMVSNEMYYGYQLPLDNESGNYGGPLFFSHYAYLGLDPHELQDQYANFWDQGVVHSTINRKYCIENPKKFIGYNENFWGLTASDNHLGYSAYAPNNDLGICSLRYIVYTS